MEDITKDELEDKITKIAKRLYQEELKDMDKLEKEFFWSAIVDNAEKKIDIKKEFPSREERIYLYQKHREFLSNKINNDIILHATEHATSEHQKRIDPELYEDNLFIQAMRSLIFDSICSHKDDAYLKYCKKEIDYIVRNLSGLKDLMHHSTYLEEKIYPDIIYKSLLSPIRKKIEILNELREKLE